MASDHPRFSFLYFIGASLSVPSLSRALCPSGSSRVADCIFLQTNIATLASYSATMASTRPQVTVEHVSEADLDRCSEIFLSAFAKDQVMHIVRPARLHDPSISHEQRLRNYTLGLKEHQFGKKGKSVLKAVDNETGEILGVGIWTSPGIPVRSSDEENKENAAPTAGETDPEEDSAALGRLVEEMTEKRELLLKNAPHW